MESMPLQISISNCIGLLPIKISNAKNFESRRTLALQNNFSFHNRLRRIINDIRCLHLTERIDLAEGGVARALLDLTHSLQNCGAKTTIASPEINIEPDSFLSACGGPRFVELRNEQSFLKQLDALIQEVDIVHLHAPWWLRNPSIVRAAFIRKKPIVLSVHGMLDDWSMQQKRFKKWLYLNVIARRMFHHSIIHCTAEHERQQVSKRVKPIAFEVLPLVIDKSLLSIPLDSKPAQARWPILKADKIKLLFLSRIHPKKSLEIAIQAMKQLQACELIIAGDGDPNYVESLKLLATKMGVDSRLHWVGMVFGKEKESLFAACDVFLLPTSQENFGLAQIEALAFGLKVISTKGTDNWQELESCGAIIVERDANAFVEAVRKCLTRTADRLTALNQQRESLRQWIEPTQITRRYIEMYERYAEMGSK
jgi:glycosyltransferase involved in cell wall biosynthesis